MVGACVSEGNCSPCASPPKVAPSSPLGGDGQMLAKITQLWRDEDGATSLELALLLAIFAALGVNSFEKIGSLLSDNVAQAAGEMSADRAKLWRQAASTGQIR